MVTDGVFAPAHVLAGAIQRREVSSLEVVEAYLTQIARHNPDLNAVVTLDEDGARMRAREADAALARGEEWGPLHGLPITLEDAHSTSGMRTTWGGLPRMADCVPEEDGTVAARLKAAGAILLGKTNGPEIWPDSIFARTSNPWNLAHTPGGSSAGVGAALAAGLTSLDVGLDTLGSIQNPAHYCGVYGMRPTEHRVPLSGLFILDPARKFRVMSVVGPMARSVEDLRLALRIIAGPDGLDTHVPPVPWRDLERPRIGDLRIAWSSEFSESNTQDEIRTVVEGVTGQLARGGATVEHSMPDVDLGHKYELGEELFDLLAGTFPEEPTAFSEEASVASKERDSLEAYLTALDRRDEVMRAWEEFFAAWDVLIMPAGTRTAERHGEEPAEPSEEYPYVLSAVSGCPMVVLPAGVDSQGLPFGLQIIGKRWDDERLLGIAESVSELTGGFRRPPGY
ncbi:MAG: amidase family protein [Actinomycetota bacterium]|nr:amidase family protein [Actinomycetota bacterium]